MKNTKLLIKKERKEKTTKIHFFRELLSQNFFSIVLPTNKFKLLSEIYPVIPFSGKANLVRESP
jgi:hypothetical protein